MPTGSTLIFSFNRLFLIPVSLGLIRQIEKRKFSDQDEGGVAVGGAPMLCPSPATVSLGADGQVQIKLFINNIKYNGGNDDDDHCDTFSSFGINRTRGSAWNLDADDRNEGSSIYYEITDRGGVSPNDYSIA